MTRIKEFEPEYQVSVTGQQNFTVLLVMEITEYTIGWICCRQKAVCFEYGWRSLLE